MRPGCDRCPPGSQTCLRTHKTVLDVQPGVGPPGSFTDPPPTPRALLASSSGLILPHGLEMWLWSRQTRHHKLCPKTEGGAFTEQTPGLSEGGWFLGAGVVGWGVGAASMSLPCAPGVPRPQTSPPWCVEVGKEWCPPQVTGERWRAQMLRIHGLLVKLAIWKETLFVSRPGRPSIHDASGATLPCLGAPSS